MSFSSEASTTLAGPLNDVFPQLSTEAQLLSLIRLSPTTHTVKITDRDCVLLHSDLTYTVVAEHDLAQYGPNGDDVRTGQNAELVERLHFELIERVSFLGIPTSVTVLGSQVASSAQYLHLYESSASNGFVKIRKTRRFSSAVGPRGAQTRIEEQILGHTNWIMSGFVGRECRRQHAAHVSQYAKLLCNQTP